MRYSLTQITLVFAPKIAAITMSRISPTISAFIQQILSHCAVKVPLAHLLGRVGFAGHPIDCKKMQEMRRHVWPV